MNRDNHQLINSTGTRVVVYTCNWKAYSGLETAGIVGLNYPATIHPIKVTCLGRIQPGIILKSFQLGAAGVLLIGCPTDECRYEFGRTRAQEMFEEAVSLLSLLGIAEERLELHWIGAGQGEEFVDLVSRFAARLGASANTIVAEQ